MRLISEQDVERLIVPADAIAAEADAYRRYATKDEPEPGRLDLKRQDPAGSVLVLAGHSDDRLFAAKTNVHAYPDAASRRRLAASMMTLWDFAACEPVALIATTGFNNHRTAAGLAAAADKLARKDARTLAIFGAGKIAPAAIRYLCAVRPFERILILGHGTTRARELASMLAREPGFAHCDLSAETDAEKAARAADVIVTLTTSSTPVFPGAAVRPGTLVILAGANRPDAREADDALIGRAEVHVDHLEGCVTRAGDLRIPLASGHLPQEQIAGEIGQLLAGDAAYVPNREITVFKSMGIIGQDLALARLILRRAREQSIGVEFDPRSGQCSFADTKPARPSADAAGRQGAPA
jgi:ornithine cyclodeaminase